MTTTSTKNRRLARTIALQALYEIDTTGHPVETVLQERIAEYNEANPIRIDDDMRIFTYKLVNGVWDSRDRVDRIVQAAAPEWPLEQVAIIDRNLLRIAIFESVIDGGTPIRVAINEAVDLAKEFGSESASRFVNGVLGTLVEDENALKALRG